MKQFSKQTKGSTANNLFKIVCPNMSASTKLLDEFVVKLSVIETDVKYESNFITQSKVRKFRFDSEKGQVILDKLGENNSGSRQKTKHVHVYVIPDIDDKVYQKAVLLLLNTAIIDILPFIKSNAEPLVLSYLDKLYYFKLDLKSQQFIHSYKSALVKHQVEVISANTPSVDDEFDAVMQQNFSKLVEHFGEDKIKEWVSNSEKAKIEDLLLKSNIKIKGRKIQEFD